MTIVLEIAVSWGAEVLVCRRLARGAARVGDAPDSMLPVPCGELGSIAFASIALGRAKAHVPAHLDAHASKRAAGGAPTALEGASDVELLLGDEVAISWGAFTLSASAVDARRARGMGASWRRLLGGATIHVAAAFLLHAALLAVAARTAFAWELGAQAPDASTIRRYLISAEARSKTPEPTNLRRRHRRGGWARGRPAYRERPARRRPTRGGGDGNRRLPAEPQCGWALRGREELDATRRPIGASSAQ